MKIDMKSCLLAAVAASLAACAPAELPESSREARREGGGNANLRLPSQWGSKPAERSRWWDGGETQYPNSGYYSSERQ